MDTALQGLLRVFDFSLDSFFPRSPAAAIATSVRGSGERGHAGLEIPLQFPPPVDFMGRICRIWFGTILIWGCCPWFVSIVCKLVLFLIVFGPVLPRVFALFVRSVSSDGCSSSSGQLWSASWQGALVQAQRCGTTIEPTGKHAFCWRGSHHVATVSRDGKMHATSPDVGATATCFLFHKLFSALHVWHSCYSETEKCTRRSTLERAEA